jgi:hypothetical protein
MILYRDKTGVVVGTQAEAKRMGKGWTQLIVPTDKQGLIDYLNAQPAIDDAFGPEPTRDEIVNSNEPAMQAKASELMNPVTSAIHNSVSIDDSWETIPLARKLHFAALAMEDARRKIS